MTMATTAYDGDRYALISVTFLDPVFHGRADGEEPEWPPSPLRLFQALLAGAAAASRAEEGIAEAGSNSKNRRSLLRLSADPGKRIDSPSRTTLWTWWRRRGPEATTAEGGTPVPPPIAR